MKSIFITATNTDIGKTYTTIKLAKVLLRRGYKVGVFKPIETGVVEDKPLDGIKLLKASKNKDISLDDVVPIKFTLPASPYVAKGDKKIDFKKIVNSYKRIKSNSDIVLVEGAGGLLVPVEENFFMIDFIELLNIDKTLLVTSNSLGSINDTLLSINLLKQRDIDFIWAVNEFKESRENFEKVTLPFYKKVLYVDEVSSWIEEIISHYKIV
jgi:dethiobiotin synthetase